MKFFFFFKYLKVLENACKKKPHKIVLEVAPVMGVAPPKKIFMTNYFQQKYDFYDK